MSSSEHYEAAERCLKLADGQETAFAVYLISVAQVHATLALWRNAS